jgi:hypothetical protein
MTHITTTTLRMVLIVLCIGIYAFISQRRTPTTISMITMVTIGIKAVLFLRKNHTIKVIDAEGKIVTQLCKEFT